MAARYPVSGCDILILLPKNVSWDSCSGVKPTGLAVQLDVVVAQHGAGEEQVLVHHHQPPRHYAYGSFEHAHMDVHFKHAYILTLKEGFGEGDGGWIVAA